MEISFNFNCNFELFKIKELLDTSSNCKSSSFDVNIVDEKEEDDEDDEEEEDMMGIYGKKGMNDRVYESLLKITKDNKTINDKCVYMGNKKKKEIGIT